MLHPRNLYTQAGALFTLYGLYYKQPLNCWVNIRVTHDQLLKILDFINLMRNDNHTDVLCIFAKLYSDDAFHFVAHEIPLGVETKFLRNYDLQPDMMFQGSKTDADKVIHDLQNSEELLEFKTLNERYQAAMKKYSGKLFPENCVLAFFFWCSRYELTAWIFV